MNDKPIVSPLGKLLYSRKVMLALLDALLSSVLFAVGRATGPETLEAVKYLIVLWQPLVVMLIVAIAYEDGQKKRAGTVAEDALERSRQAGYVEGFDAAERLAWEAQHADASGAVPEMADRQQEDDMGLLATHILANCRREIGAGNPAVGEGAEEVAVRLLARMSAGINAALEEIGPPGRGPQNPAISVLKKALGRYGEQ